MIKDISLKVDDGELSTLYNVLRTIKDYTGPDNDGPDIKSKAGKWMGDLSSAYRSSDSYMMVFRGGDAFELYIMVASYISRKSPGSKGYRICHSIYNMFGDDNYTLGNPTPGSTRKLFTGVVGDEMESANRRHQSYVDTEAERRREENRREEIEGRERRAEEAEEAEESSTEERERRELQRIADAGQAWDTGSSDGDSGFWSTNTDDVPY